MKFSALDVEEWGEEEDEHRELRGVPVFGDNEGLRSVRIYDYHDGMDDLRWYDMFTDRNMLHLSIVHGVVHHNCNYYVDVYVELYNSSDAWSKFLRFIERVINEKAVTMSYNDVECGVVRPFILDNHAKRAEEIYLAFRMAVDNEYRLEVNVNCRDQSQSGSTGKNEPAATGYRAHPIGVKDMKFSQDIGPKAFIPATGSNAAPFSRASAAEAPDACVFRKENRRSSRATGKKTSRVVDYDADALEHAMMCGEFADYKIRVDNLAVSVARIGRSVEMLMSSHAFTQQPGAAEQQKQMESMMQRLQHLKPVHPRPHQCKRQCKVGMAKIQRTLAKERQSMVEEKTTLTASSAKTVPGLMSEDPNATAIPPFASNKELTPTACKLLDKPAAPPVHWDVLCNICRKEIVGVRYVCGNCVDFDLCAACEDSADCHFPDHVFIKIRVPVAKISLNEKAGKVLPLLEHSLYDTKDPWFSKSADGPADEVVASTNHEQIRSIKSIMDAEFVDDETVPDGTIFHPRQRFTKSWRVVNSGSRSWNEDTSLKFLWGTKGFVPNHLEVVVPPLLPKHRGKISVGYVSPEKPGFYESHWNFVHKGHLFGHRIWCSIEVIDPDAVAKPAEVVGSVAAEVLHEPQNAERDHTESTLDSGDCQQSNKSDSIVCDHLQEGQKTTFLSQTATPNNTPFVLSPPKSPEPLDLEVSMMGLKCPDDMSIVADSEFTRVTSTSSSDGETEYMVVPMPSCFTFDHSESSSTVKEQKCTSSFMDSSTVFIGSEGDEVEPDGFPKMERTSSHSSSSSCEFLPDTRNEALLFASASSSMFVMSPCDPILETQKETGAFDAASAHSVATSSSMSSCEFVPDIQKETGACGSSSSSLSPPPQPAEETAVKNIKKISSETGEINDEFNNSTEHREDDQNSFATSSLHEESNVDDQATGGSESDTAKATDKSPDLGDISNTVADVLNRMPVSRLAAAFSTIYNGVYQALKDAESDEGGAQAIAPQMIGIHTQPTSLPAAQLAPLLNEMGFTDTVVNDRLTAKHNGNLQKILDDLMKDADPDWYNRRH